MKKLQIEIFYNKTLKSLSNFINQMEYKGNKPVLAENLITELKKLIS